VEGCKRIGTKKGQRKDVMRWERKGTMEGCKRIRKKRDSGRM
jgi:hypothetical protein